MATSSLTNYTDNAILQHFFKGGAAVTQPTALTVALYTVDPTKTGAAGTEVSTSYGYARQTVTFGTPASGSVSNTGTALTFGPCTGTAWGSIVAVGVFDNSGNMLAVGAVSPSKTINVGDSFQIAVGNLTVSVN